VEVEWGLASAEIHMSITDTRLRIRPVVRHTLSLRFPCLFGSDSFRIQSMPACSFVVGLKLCSPDCRYLKHPAAFYGCALSCRIHKKTESEPGQAKKRGGSAFQSKGSFRNCRSSQGKRSERVRSRKNIGAHQLNHDGLCSKIKLVLGRAEHAQSSLETGTK
jgi:hypothetical protein